MEKANLCNSFEIRYDFICMKYNLCLIFFLDCKLQIVKLFLVIMSIVYFCKMLVSHMTTYADILRHSSNWPRNNFCWAFKVLCQGLLDTIIMIICHTFFLYIPLHLMCNCASFKDSITELLNLFHTKLSFLYHKNNYLTFMNKESNKQHFTGDQNQNSFFGNCAYIRRNLKIEIHYYA